MPQTTSNPLRDQRLRRGWTLRDLAAECEARGVQIDFGQLGRIERHEAIPRPALGKVLGDLLGVDPATAFRKEDVS
jgi:transcriptional regulator with XRE-family HTH domain